MNVEQRTVYLTESAQNTILGSLRTSVQHRLEQGGSLLACESQSPPLIVVAVPTGPNADQGYAHLETDAHYQNTAIAAIRRTFPNLTYVGDWHIHPMHLPFLSSTDMETAGKLLTETTPARSHVDLLLGTPGHNGDELLLGFRVSLMPRYGLWMEPLQLAVVPDDDAVVINRLKQSVPPLERLLNPGPTTTAAPVVIPPETSARIERDLQEVRSRLHAETKLQMLSCGTLAAHIVRGGHEVSVVFPPEYPMGAPLVLSGQLQSGPLTPIPLRYGWSSLHRLTDVVEEGLRAGDGDPPITWVHRLFRTRKRRLTCSSPTIQSSGGSL
ncbi:MAG: Mov34/MPN/PAD-1 family protein [Myxococcales bacterium]|nr:Mov34/MPN/PAD-1 family protein [Myxococcales bacterium]